MVQASKCLGNIDSSVFLVPLLRELLKHDIAGLQINEDVLQCALVAKLRCACIMLNHDIDDRSIYNANVIVDVSTALLCSCSCRASRQPTSSTTVCRACRAYRVSMQ